MLPTVDLNDQPRFEADEIKDVAVEGNLPFELQPFELFVAKRLPEQGFGLGGVGADGTGEGAVTWRDGLAQWPPPLLDFL